MYRVAGLALLAVGVVLLAMGITAADSFSSDVSRFFSGNPTDKSIWLIIGGAACLVVGAGGLFFGRNRPSPSR